MSLWWVLFWWVATHFRRGYSPDSKVHGANMGPPGSCRPRVMLAPWTLLSRRILYSDWVHFGLTSDPEHITSPWGVDERCGRILRSLGLSQWPRLKYEFLCYYDSTNVISNQQMLKMRQRIPSSGLPRWQRIKSEKHRQARHSRELKSWFEPQLKDHVHSVWDRMDNNSKLQKIFTIFFFTLCMLNAFQEA